MVHKAAAALIECAAGGDNTNTTDQLCDLVGNWLHMLKRQNQTKETKIVASINQTITNSSIAFKNSKKNFY